eukprot:TRINITY_DN24832_c0_g1_i1.p1 TRINITY_DN24832_c0_g1~~TRINITY_DN24832_c0_g1_i1.p1  ORF type:complete len:287 (-),score=71.54 TRINITY_DN24832_c0_g1_i1:43-903(-)
MTTAWVHGTVYTPEDSWKEAGSGGWARDIQIENAPLETTGGHVWNAAFRLFHFFEEMWEGDLLKKLLTPPQTTLQNAIPIPATSKVGPKKLNILELGAGCGWLGMALARNLPSSINKMVLTEQVVGGALEWLDHNVKLNQKAGLLLDNVQTCACDWNHYIQFLNHKNGSPEIASTELKDIDTSLADTTWDLIIGSDLVYNKAGTHMLPKVMRALVGEHTLIFYSHTKKRLEDYDIQFFEELEANGLSCEELREPSISTPPPSPPPYTEVFPWQRIAVYLITLKKDQ